MFADARITKFFETAPWNTRPAKPAALPDEGSRVRFAVLFLALGLGSLAIASLKPWGSITAYLITLLFASSAVAYIVSNRDALLAKLFFATLVAGCVKLYADWYLVVTASSLVYAQEGPFILRSPVYMPFLWACMLWAITVITRWIDLRHGLIAAMAGGACHWRSQLSGLRTSRRQCGLVGLSRRFANRSCASIPGRCRIPGHCRPAPAWTRG